MMKHAFLIFVAFSALLFINCQRTKPQAENPTFSGDWFGVPVKGIDTIFVNVTKCDASHFMGRGYSKQNGSIIVDGYNNFSLISFTITAWKGQDGFFEGKWESTDKIVPTSYLKDKNPIQVTWLKVDGKPK